LEPIVAGMGRKEGDLLATPARKEKGEGGNRPAARFFGKKLRGKEGKGAAASKRGGDYLRVV